ncbi:MAG: hypothetical protein ACKOX3_05500 [Bacteroidota bacterium]
MKKIVYLFCALIFASTISSCEKETTAPALAKFKILSVRVEAMPALDPVGAGWDLFDDADVFFNIEDQNHIPYYLGSDYKVGNVAQVDLPISWSLTNAYPINDISKITYISVYDYDVLDANDPIGNVGFKMQDYDTGKPTSITKSNGALTVTITGTWY